MKQYPARRARVPSVHLLAGLNGSGKTRLARELELRCPAVRFTLDEWMLRLHRLPIDDPRYGELAAQCQELIWDTARQVLATHTDVVLDWNQWSRERRAGWRDRIRAAGARPVLHHVRVPLEVAVGQAAGRRDPYAHALDRAGIEHLAGLFEEPGADEGLEIRIVTPDQLVTQKHHD
ncbi:AAA family ATPase [Microlunatus speluncae]|uniref:AAA family ATPase n=1 Tax=Microlunatus speluncae TaxID=2594267 RepID=UPI00137567E2|nr:ATP-binding protein [Microlunatus speluncae]